MGSYKGTERNPSFPNAATINPRDTEGALGAGLKKAVSYKGVDRNPSIYELRAAQAEDAALNKSYAGIKILTWGRCLTHRSAPKTLTPAESRRTQLGIPNF